MPRFPIYHSIKRVILVLPFIFFFPEINAQSNDQPDTTRIITDDTVDSLQTTTFDERGLQDFPDSGVTESPGYFLDRKLQVSGGGPDTLEVRKLPDSVLKKMQADEHFWYANHQFKKEKKKEEESSFMDSTAFQTLLWLIIVGGFAAFVVIYLSNSNVGLFRKGGKTIASNTEGEVETDNIFEINYQREIDKAVSAGNYRFAVRLMFLRVLKNLSDKKVIQYKHDRTNFDYLMQLHATKYYPDFFRLTRNYEYSWYGQFAIEADKFSVIKKDFESFDHNLNHR